MSISGVPGWTMVSLSWATRSTTPATGAVTFQLSVGRRLGVVAVSRSMAAHLLELVLGRMVLELGGAQFAIGDASRKLGTLQRLSGRRPRSASSGSVRVRVFA